MNLRTKIKILTFFVLFNIFYSLFSMKRSATEEASLSKRIKTEGKFLEIPEEILFNILIILFNQIIVDEDNIVDIFSRINNYLVILSKVNSQFNGMVQYILDNKLLSRLINNYFKENLGIYEQTQLNLELSNIIVGQGSKENEIKALKLILAGANPNLLLEKSQSKIDDEGELEESDENHQTKSCPILHAVYQSNKFSSDLIDILIRCGADVNAKDSFDKILIVYAIESLDVDMVNFLISKGANVNIQDSKNRNVLVYFISNYRNIKKNQLTMLAKDIENPNIQCSFNLLKAAKTVDDSLGKIFDILVNNTQNLNIQNKDEDTALILACKLGSVKMVSRLIESGANVEDIMKVIEYYKFEKEEIFNVIKENASNGQISVDYEQARLSLYYVFDCIKLLLSKLNPNYKDSKGNTLLTWSSYIGCLEVVDILIKTNVDLNMPDQNGDTALMLATLYGNTEVVKRLIESGANLEVKDSGGFTLLDIARHNNYTDIASLLTKYMI